MRRDNYSNMYSWEEQQLKQQRQQLPQWPMKLADAIGTRSGEAWLALIDVAERTAVEKAVLRRRCKAGELEKALPLPDRLAASRPAAACAAGGHEPFPARSPRAGAGRFSAAESVKWRLNKNESCREYQSLTTTRLALQERHTAI